MSKWKYKTDTVTVGDNSQKVRMLTAGERKDFAQRSRDIAAGTFEKNLLPQMIVKFGAIEPTLTDEDVAEMPADLLDECVGRIMELTGMKKPTDGDEEPEKKEPQSL